MSNAIFEIFSEELPATLQKKIAEDYKQFAEKELKTLGITVKSDNIFVGITLNRLVLKLENAKISQEQLLDFIDKTLKDFSKMFPRTMCYPQLEVRWLRPIRGLFACIDKQVLSGKFHGIELTNGTFINKFDFVKCSGFDDYFSILAREQIEIDYNKRLEFVKKEIYDFDKKIIKKNIGKTLKNNTDVTNNVGITDYDTYWKYYANNKLAEEIAGMSEYCTEPMVSTLDARFNVLPFELIELVLRENQRYVVFRPNDKKEIKFLIFGDKITADKIKRDSIVRGHRKVVNARLDDALYYWQLDENIKNDKEKLKSILSARTFIDDITWGDYLKRQEELAEAIISDKDTLEAVKQLIWDTKLDLATGVVAEFPELQGVIGDYYFNYQETCRTYKNKEQLPFHINPYVLSEEQMQRFDNSFAPIAYFYLIDRMEYIHTMYQQGKQPTGSGDKYKVKARMDDVVKLYVDYRNGLFDRNIAFGNTWKEHHDIENLFCKRYQKYIEDNYKNVKNIKQFAEIGANIRKWFDLKKTIDMFLNEEFVKIYKRIHGYTKTVKFVDGQDIENKAKEIYNNEDIKTIEEFLDDHKIEGDDLTKQALKWIETKYFEPHLPVEFLEII